ncbi:MAG TPA: cytochrome c biogenesis protein CcsA [Symbiobacteriaceae bacterium]|nr:cytochrome c biogenesis protein CcsA [Symbiobacteriaceae bacterium]
MTQGMLIAVSAWLLGLAFAGYVAATLLYGANVIGGRISGGTRFAKAGRWATNAHLLAVGLHFVAILARWQGAGHWPTSNMYEFIGFMAFTSQLAFQVIIRMYRLNVLGALVGPVGVFLMAYSYVFPPKVQPLVPALKSYWLPLHVSMAALGEGFFAVAFGAAFLYLLRVRGLELAAEAAGQGSIAVGAGSGVALPAGESKQSRFERTWGQKGMELLFYGISVMVGFTLLALIFRYSGFQWLFERSTYHLPPIIGPVGEAVGSKGELFGLIPMPLVEAPGWMRGKHMNTMLYSLAAGGLIYWLVRRFLAKGQPIGDWLARKVSGDPELLDEISYRAVAIGYPVFTLGGLIFAMLWAKEAWGDYWFWDPKETWALIAWLVYSAYLHVRITHGWEGRRSAWLAVLGFGVILFTLIGVNLLIVGVHSYAGGDM